MPQNTSPIFTLTPKISSAILSAANAKSDGAGTVGTDLFLCFTAGSNGSFVSSVRFNPFASVANTTTTATTLRCFIANTNTGTLTSASCWLFQEVSAAAQAADHSTNPTFFIEIPINRALPAGYTIICTTHVVPAANTGWQATVFGGDY